MLLKQKGKILLIEKGLKYANDVVNGKELTTREVKQQCEHFINDYNNRQYDNKFKYEFCENKLKIINNLLKLFLFVTGFLVGQSVLKEMANFQAFVLINIFGWRYKEDNSKFRYRDVVIFIPRKNGKSFLLSLVQLLLMLTEPNYSEFYSICINRDLAGEIKKAMTQLINGSAALKRHFKLSRQLSGKIECKITNSYYQARTAEANSNNAIRPAAVIADECGAFTSTDNIQAMRTGQLSVNNPLMLKITTAYAESDSIMIEELEYCRAVLNGTIENERYFCLLYYCDKEEAWTDVGILKANPLRLEQNIEEIKNTRDIAKIKINEQQEFLTKHLNIFLESNEINKYIDMRYWKKCRADAVDFSGKNVVIGVDLSVTTDLTAVSIMYKENNILYCKSHGFLPCGTLDTRRENINYIEYERLGYCSIHDGMTVSYTLVEKYIRGIEQEYNCKIECIVTDPYNAKELMERLGNDYDVIFLKQTYTNLSPATKEFRKKVYDHEVRYEKNELLDWNMSNAITTKGRADDEMLAKENKNKQRIDMVAVLIFAFTELFDMNEFDAIAALDKTDW